MQILVESISEETKKHTLDVMRSTMCKEIGGWHGV